MQKVFSSVSSQIRAQIKLNSGHSFLVVKNDITKEKVDAIVNAANNLLMHGGGLAGAIVREGGFEIQRESNEIVKENGAIPTGSTAITNAGKLHAKHIIHAVGKFFQDSNNFSGPVWKDGNSKEDELLKQAVWNSLQSARELDAKSISIPAISSGIFGFPKERCASIVIKTSLEYATKHPNQNPTEIRFTNFDEITVSIFAKEFERLFPN